MVPASGGALADETHTHTHTPNTYRRGIIWRFSTSQARNKSSGRTSSVNNLLPFLYSHNSNYRPPR